MDLPSVPEMIKRQKTPIKRIPGVDKAFMDVLLNAMAENPEDRPTAAQFRDQLTNLNLSPQLAPKPLPAPEATEESPAPPSTAERVPAERVPAERVPAKAEPATAQPASRWERRGLLTLAVVAVVIAVASVIAVVNLATRTPAVEPTPSATSQAPASPSGTPVTVPAGFVDCSEQLGMDTYCAARPECWGGVNGFGDVLWVGVPASCDQTHVYQTFLAGRMTYELRRQSQLKSDAHILRVCTKEIANSMLRSGDRRSDWEIYAIGPQHDNEYYFRCIIGRGERSEPFTFHPPG
jgi:hypothetical protein